MRWSKWLCNVITGWLNKLRLQWCRFYKPIYIVHNNVGLIFLLALRVGYILNMTVPSFICSEIAVIHYHAMILLCCGTEERMKVVMVTKQKKTADAIIWRKEGHRDRWGYRETERTKAT